jgi:hypothetical protein
VAAEDETDAVDAVDETGTGTEEEVDEHTDDEGDGR